MPRAGPVYRQIAEAIERDIMSGRLRRGQQLPTHRSLARALGIDLTTVTRAYADAGGRGLVEGRVGQGTFVSESSLRPPTLAADVIDVDLSMNVPPQPAEAALDSRIAQGLAAIERRAGFSALLNYQQPGEARPSSRKRRDGSPLACRACPSTGSRFFLAASRRSSAHCFTFAVPATAC